MTITFKDGSTRSVQLGRRFGVAAGMTLPHEIVCPLNVGDKVKQGQIVTYNTRYFELDPLDPTQALWKAGVLVKTAILESPDTLEDSSAISEEVAKELATQVTSVRDLVLDFKQVIRNMLSVGTEVDAESILCIIEDPVMAQNDLFDESSLDTLQLLSANTPRAKSKGVIEKIEVFYNGDLEDLSPSLQELALQSDRQRKREARDLGKPYTSGRVDETMSLDGNPLPSDHLVIRVYLTSTVKYSVGDKSVFGNQLKTVCGRVLKGTNTTESGEPLGAMFAYSSVSDRLVLSPELIGTTNTLLKLISLKVANIYFGN